MKEPPALLGWTIRGILLALLLGLACSAGAADPEVCYTGEGLTRR